MNFGISIILKKNQLKMSLNFLSQLSLQDHTFSMEQFSNSVNKFLVFLDYKILPDKGHISAAQAKAKAEGEYEIFNRTQVIDSDFDKQIREIQKKGK